MARGQLHQSVLGRLMRPENSGSWPALYRENKIWVAKIVVVREVDGEIYVTLESHDGRTVDPFKLSWALLILEGSVMRGADSFWIPGAANIQQIVITDPTTGKVEIR